MISWSNYRLNRHGIQVLLIKYVQTFKYLQANGLLILWVDKDEKAADSTQKWWNEPCGSSHSMSGNVPLAVEI